MDKGNQKMHFGIPVILCESRNDVHDCYFCITPAYGCTNKTKHKIQYPNWDSAILPVLHSVKIPVPEFIKFKDCDDPNSSFVLEVDHVTDQMSWIFLKLAPAPRPLQFHGFGM